MGKDTKNPYTNKAPPVDEDWRWHDVSGIVTKLGRQIGKRETSDIDTVTADKKIVPKVNNEESVTLEVHP